MSALSKGVRGALGGGRVGCSASTGGRPGRTPRRSQSTRRIALGCSSYTRSELPQERDQIGLLLGTQLHIEDQVEELNGILERRQAAVVEIRGRVLDAAEREGLDPALGAAGVEF